MRTNGRRRRVAHVQELGLHGWFLNQISLGNVAIIVSFVITASVFYADTRSTAASQSAAIAQLAQKMTETEKSEERKERAAIAERDKLRTEVSTRAEKTADSLALINEKTAVFSAQLIAIREEIGKLSVQITNLNGVPAPARR